MQKFGLKTTKSKRARRETEAEEEAEAALQFKVVLCSISAHCQPAILHVGRPLSTAYQPVTTHSMLASHLAQLGSQPLSTAC